MSCPVVRTIEELYGGYDYGNSQPYVQLISPTGISGGGSSSVDISMEAAKFYITARKLQFARAELITSGSQHSVITKPTAATNDVNIHQNTNQTAEIVPIQSALIASNSDFNPVYFERMFKKYYGKTSYQIFEEIVGKSLNKTYLTMTRVIDTIDIMEGVCYGTLARDFPSGMSLPTFNFDPSVIESIGAAAAVSAIGTEVNKVIDYANGLCVGGMRTKIEPIERFNLTLRDFTFASPTAQTLSEYKKLLTLDMEVAEYAHAVEQYHCEVIKKMNDVLNLCQSIIDLAK